MKFIKRHFSLIVACFICLLSTLAITVNSFVFKFSGNNYLTQAILTIPINLALVYWGLSILIDKNSPYMKISINLIYFLLIYPVIALATYAVQFTPFPPIDRFLILIDSSLGIHQERIMRWTAEIPWLYTLLALIYDSLALQMCLLPLIIIAMRKFDYLYEYIALMLISTLIGFSFYYFFPTMGPASFLHSPYFMPEQYATGIKFTEIQHHQLPSTMAGGMIAMPSFHVIWAWLCIYIVRHTFLVFILAPLNALLIASCVMIGWHYFIDLIGSLVVLLIGHACYYYFVKKQYVTS